MLRTSSPYEACRTLFARYPQAAGTVDPSGTVYSMVLMLPDGDDAGFFVLSHQHGESGSSYSLWSWPAGDVVDIDAEGSTPVPVHAVSAVTCGVPIPRDGSLLGWTRGDEVTALIVIYARYTSAHPEPGWAVMPRAGTPEALWPSFTGGPLFGHWSWEQYWAGSIVSLDRLIAAVPGAVCWVDTTATLGSNCCVVASDITDPSGYTLRRGRYVDYEVLRAGKTVPALEALLADPDKIDLAPRFREWLAQGARR
jgi:hypothetical protein